MTTAEDICRHYEDLKLKAYLCPAGIPSLGYGHTAGVKLGDTCTKEQAEEWLAEDVAEARRIVTHAVKVHLTQNQIEACTSFVFNVGPGVKGVKSGFVTLKDGRPSSLLRYINAGQFHDAADEFPKWNKGGGKILGGLVKRRESERLLFMS